MIELILVTEPENKPQALWLGKENGKPAFLFSPEADKFDTVEEAQESLDEFKKGKIFPHHTFEINEHIFTDGDEIETAD